MKSSYKHDLDLHSEVVNADGKIFVETMAALPDSDKGMYNDIRVYLNKGDPKARLIAKRQDSIRIEDEDGKMILDMYLVKFLSVADKLQRMAEMEELL